MAKKNWIGKAAASIKRRGTAGKCTPMTKPGCTGRARALALTFKKIARNRKKEDGGVIEFANGGVASMILANKYKYSSALIRRANSTKNQSKWRLEDGGLVQYNLGGQLASLGSAAAMIPTPWTQIGGTALTLLGGILDGNSQKNIQEEENVRRIRSSSANAQLGAGNPFAPSFARGGVMPNMYPNVEVEGGEVIQGMDKSVAKVIGPKHSRGGVPLAMANGGRVFSDRIMNPDTGRTFAEDAQILMKQLR